MTKRILIIGASGLIGGAVARAAEAAGHEVVRASRSSDELVDVRDAESLAALFERVGAVDAVVATLGKAPFKPLADLGLDDFRVGFDDKALGQIALAAGAVEYLRDGGSITLTTGVLSASPVPTGAAAFVANGAVNAYAMAAAPYLPRGLRINVISPNVLLESPGSHDSFPGFTPVPVADVARAYLQVIDGDESGQVVAV